MSVLTPTMLPWLALGLGVASGVLSALAIAVSIVPKAAVEEIADRARRARQSARAGRVMEHWTGHARALWLPKLLLDALATCAVIWWVAALRAPAAPVLASVGEAGGGLGVGLFPSPGLIDAGIGVGVSVLVLWVLTVAVPMAVALHAGPRLIFARASLISAVGWMSSPLGAIGRVTDETVRRLVGVERKDADEQVEEELLTVVEEAEASGALDGREADMLASVMRFRDLTVAQIMTPRTDMEAIELTNDLGGVIRAVREVKHSRIPVYEESLDHIAGIFYVKDLMMWLGGEGKATGKPFELKQLLRSAIFVPETKTVSDLLRELMEKKVHIALVADEYGGTAGLVTIEDIVEEVFGDIKDEYEAPQADSPDAVVKLDQRTAELDAAARVSDVNELIEPLGVQIPSSEDYDTVGGFVVTTLGRIPAAGESFLQERSHFTVLEARPTKVVRVRLEVRDEEAAGEAVAEESQRGRGA